MKLSTNKEEILGHWVISGNDLNAQENLGKVLLKFSPDGILTYTVFEQDERVMILVYEIVNDEIITAQQSTAYQKEVTKFCIIGGELVLNFNGIESRFIRLPE